MSARLSEARDSYAQGDYLRAFALCKDILENEAPSPEALLLFARLCKDAGDAVTAALCARHALQLDANDAEAAALLEQLEASAKPEAAQDAYSLALQLDPDMAAHTNAAVFAQPGDTRVEALLRDALAHDVTGAPAHAALGNVLGRMGRIDESLASYARAVVLDPQAADVRLGYAERLRLFGDGIAAREHLHAALTQSRVFSEKATDEEQVRIVALCAPSFWEDNIALDLLVDRARVTVHKQYLGSETPIAQCGVLFNAIADCNDAALLAEAERAVEGLAPRRCLNHPRLLSRTARTYLSESGVLGAHAVVPATRRVAKQRLALGEVPVAFPALIRPLHSHRGAGLQLVRSAGDLHTYLQKSLESEFYMSDFRDYRSADGYYRKYRFIFVAGRPYPYHLAISSEWMVHYFSAQMHEYEWMREEEAAFLKEPFEVFGPRAQQAFGMLARSLELDYFGVDCSVLDGEVLVFEANANMLVHSLDALDLFAYKMPAVQKIRDAFEALARNG